MGFHMEYEIEFTGTIVEKDGGYWRKTALEEFLEKVRIDHFQILLKEGGTEPKPFPVKMSIKKVSVVAD